MARLITVTVIAAMIACISFTTRAEEQAGDVIPEVPHDHHDHDGHDHHHDHDGHDHHDHDGHDHDHDHSEEAQPEEGSGEPEEIEITNPNFDEDVKRLKRLCKTIEEEMKEVFVLKNHYKQEAGIMSHAANLGQHLDTRHEEWKTQHHDEWNCKQAREVMAHESAKKFVEHFENWYEGKTLKPEISHNESVRLVTHLREEMHYLGLMNQDTLDELNRILHDLEHLEKWHLNLRVAYDELMADPDNMNCEKPFQAFMKALHDIHSEHVPDWFHLGEGVALLHQQCKEDPALNDEKTEL